LDDQIKFTIHIQNNGTIVINNPYVKIDLGNEFSLNHKIDASLMPGESGGYEIDFEIIKRSNQPLNYICFSLVKQLGAYVDIEPFDNEQCISIDNSFNVLEPFPNPARTHVDIPFILPSAGDCDFQMAGENGNIVYLKKFLNLNAGLNTIQMDLAPYRNGFYLLTIRYADIETTKKIVIQ
jgi:hypothetical protein